MEKVDRHKSIVKEVIEEIYNMIPPDDQIETQLVEDDIRGHYQLNEVGWLNDTYRRRNNFMHIDVKPDGKVWIQHDGTDLKVALMLYEKGIEKSDIVLAFHAVHRRELIPEFAIN